MEKEKMKRGPQATDPLERVAHSIDLLVRLKLDELKGERSQREMIRFLGGLGATGGEIASLLGVSRTTVDPELSKARAGNDTKGRVRPRSQRRKG
jgi:DNA-directed RNA polymerase specialized sigma24 family protein